MPSQKQELAAEALNGKEQDQSMVAEHQHHFTTPTALRRLRPDANVLPKLFFYNTTTFYFCHAEFSPTGVLLVLTCSPPNHQEATTGNKHDGGQ